MEASAQVIDYDVAAIGSVAVRRQLEGTLNGLSLHKRDGVWETLSQARRRFPSARTLLVGDLFHLTRSRGLDHLAGGPPSLSIVFLVRTQRDRRLLLRPDIAMRLGDDRFFVLNFTSSAKEPGASATLTDYFRMIVERLQPGRVVAARYSSVDEVLWLEFGDGLERAVRWSSLPFAARLGLVPASACARAHGQSVLLVDADGAEIDIDAGVLRSAVDAGFRRSMVEQHGSARGALGAKIHRLREECGLTQQQVEARSGIPQETLSRIENGRRDPRLGTLEKLATALSMDVSELLARLAG